MLKPNLKLKMKKFLYIALISLLLGNTIVYAAPVINFQKDIQPVTDSTFSLGTTTPSVKAWLRVIADSFFDTDASDGCATWSSNVLTSTGIPCGSGGGGGADGNWVFFNGSGIRLATTSNQVAIGATATTTGAKLEVTGNSLFNGNIDVSNSIPLLSLTDTDSSADDFALFTNSSAWTFWNTTDSVSYLTGDNNHALQIGALSVPSLTVITNSTGDAEVVLPNDSIGPAEVLDTGDYTFANATSTGNLGFNGEIQPDGALCADGEILKKTGAGDWDCAADATGGGGSFPFTATTNYGQVVYATNTPSLWFQGGLFASSTSQIQYASTTLLSASGLCLLGDLPCQTTWSTEGRIITVGNATDLVGYINGSAGYAQAVDGDTVVMSGNITPGTPLNIKPGVTLDLGGFTLTGQFFNDAGGNQAIIKIVNGTVDSSSLAAGAPAGHTTYGANHFGDGSYYIDGVTFTGNNFATGGNMVTFVANTYPTYARVMQSHIEEAELDNISTKAPGAGLGARSLLLLENVEVNNSGSSSASNQNITAHDDFEIIGRKLYLHTPEFATVGAQLVASDTGGADTPIHLYNSNLVGGRVLLTTIVDSSLTLQNLDNSEGILLIGTNARAVNNTITHPSGVGRNGVVTHTSFAASNVVIHSNYITGMGQSSAQGGIFVPENASLTGTTTITRNHVANSRRGIDMRNTTAGGFTLAGNRTTGITQFDALTVGSPLIDNQGGNFWSGIGYSGFTPDVEDNSIASKLYVTSTGVGIGTTTPYAALSVVGEAVARNFTATSSAATSTFSGDLRFDGEIMPDGATCSAGQILKKTGANDWDCAADNSTAGSGSGNVATSTNETAGRLAYFTSTSGSPATVGEVATTTLTGTSPIALSNAISVIGGSASAISINNDGITDTHLAFNTGQHLTTSSGVSHANLTLNGGLDSFKIQAASANASNYLTFTNNDTSARAYLGYLDTNPLTLSLRNIQSGPIVIIPPTGYNVGVGTTSPGAKLTVWGDTSANDLLNVVTTASTTALRVSSSGAATTTVTALAISGVTNSILKTNSAGSVVGISATNTSPNLLPGSNPIGDGAFQEELGVSGTNDVARPPFWVASSTTAKVGHHGSFIIPPNCNDSVYSMMTTYTVAVGSGNVVIDLDVAGIGGDDTESFDISAWEESLTATDAAPGAALRRLTRTFTLSPANLAPGDSLEWALMRDGLDAADDAAGGLLFKELIFECSM